MRFTPTTAKNSARKRSRLHVRWVGLSVLVLATFLGAGVYPGGSEAATAPPLGTAESFAVLAGSGISNTNSTTITGDVGSFPTTTQSGFGSVTLNGVNHGGNAVTQGAKNSLVTAYVNAAGQTPVTTVPTELGGTVVIPGTYDSAAGTFGITGTVTLNAQGDPNAVFIFKMASSLTTASASNVNLIGSASACNVFWQVGSSATLGTNSTFRGNILALTSITLTSGASVTGRVLARNGAVTMDNNTISAASCGANSTSPDEDAEDAEDSEDVPTGFIEQPGDSDTTSGGITPVAGAPTTPTTGTTTPRPPASPVRPPASPILPPSTGDAGLRSGAAP